MVLKAFAVHPRYRQIKEALHAANLLKTRFKPDVYRSYKDREYWIRFRFWWLNILTSLDSLSRMGFGLEDPDVDRAVNWLIRNQLPDGLWKTNYKKGDASRNTPREYENRLWLTLQICRILKRLHEK
jgi:hypothetical protein